MSSKDAEMYVIENVSIPHLRNEFDLVAIRFNQSNGLFVAHLGYYLSFSRKSIVVVVIVIVIVIVDHCYRHYNHSPCSHFPEPFVAVIY